MSIVTEQGVKYRLHSISDSTVNITGTCTKLTLFRCKNIIISAVKMPIMGIQIIHCDNINVNTHNDLSGAGSHMILEHTVSAKLEIDHECTVDIDDCMDVVLNDINISDLYYDSTWQIK
jgi:hypothetical protein